MSKLIILFSSVLVVFGMLTSCGKNVPKKLNEVIFEKSKYSIPIILELPAEDDPKIIGNLKNKIYYSPFPPLCMLSYNIIDKKVLEVLVKHGFIVVNKIQVKYIPFGSRKIQFEEYGYLVYSEKIKPYIYKGDIKNYGEKFEIRLASRRLQSIDYINEYKISGVKCFAVTFSYILNKDFPFLEDLIKIKSIHTFHLKNLKKDKIYKGKAVAYLDPEDGQWKLDRMDLEDERSFLEDISKN